MSQPKPDFSQLSIAERIVLVEDIWDSIVAESPGAVELSESQRQEIRRRIAAHDSDPGAHFGDRDRSFRSIVTGDC